MLDVFIDTLHKEVFGDVAYDVVESDETVHYYHLRKKGETLSVCGRKVLSTTIQLKDWGKADRINARWCTKCAESV